MKNIKFNNNYVYLFQNKDGSYLIDSLQPVLLSSVEYAFHSSTRYLNVKIGSNGIPMRKVKDNMFNNERQLPELYVCREDCCGCSACYSICPMSGLEVELTGKNKGKIKYEISRKSNMSDNFIHTGAITMIPDEEGFFYPVIDAEICIRCYRCIEVCPIKKNNK